MTSETRHPITRRRLLRGATAAGAAALCTPAIVTAGEAQEDRRLVLPTYGGSYEETLQRVFAKPFQQETGIEVIFSGVPDLARLKAQVMSGRPDWDVFEGGGAWGPTGSQQNLFEPLDRTIVTEADALHGKNGDYTHFYRWVGVIAWNTDRVKDAAAPRNFTQFWDTKQFPGNRTLRNRADYVLELALVADGVDPAHLYPLDLDRAFRSLQRIKPFVPKWAESSSQLVTLLVTGEVEMGFNYNNRIKAARAANSPVNLSLDQAFIGNETIAVVRGTTRKIAAMKFVSFVLRPDRQAALANDASFLPATAAALPLMDAEARKWLPDPARHDHIEQDDEWWAGRDQEVQLRFREFLLS